MVHFYASQIEVMIQSFLLILRCEKGTTMRSGFRVITLRHQRSDIQILKRFETKALMLSANIARVTKRTMT